MKTLGERIADLRRERGITQENLAGIIGVSAQAISKWENNATMPDIMLLPIIADTLGVTIDELFGIRHKVQEKPINCEETPKAVYYTCTDEIFAVLGKVYVADEQSKKIIDGMVMKLLNLHRKQ